jgi:hypothetical protein
VQWLRAHPYDKPLGRPRLLVIVVLSVATIAAMFVFLDRPAASANAAPSEFDLTPSLAAPVAPDLALTCPHDAAGPWAWYDVSFGYELDSATPVARFDIDYGDGHTYSSASLDGVFTHRYANSGSFPVSVTVTNVHGQSETVACSWHLSLRALS